MLLTRRLSLPAHCLVLVGFIFVHAGCQSTEDEAKSSTVIKGVMLTFGVIVAIALVIIAGCAVAVHLEHRKAQQSAHGGSETKSAAANVAKELNFDGVQNPVQGGAVSPPPSPWANPGGPSPADIEAEGSHATFYNVLCVAYPLVN